MHEAGQIARLGQDAFPHFAALLELGVGRVGAKDEQQTDDGNRGRVGQRRKVRVRRGQHVGMAQQPGPDETPRKEDRDGSLGLFEHAGGRQTAQNLQPRRGGVARIAVQVRRAGRVVVGGKQEGWWRRSGGGGFG